MLRKKEIPQYCGRNHGFELNMPISHDSKDESFDPTQHRFKDDVTVVVAKAIMAAPGTFMIGASVIMFITSFLGLYATFGMEEDVEVIVMKWFQLRVNDRWAADLGRRIQDRQEADKTVEHAIRGGYITFGFLANGLVLFAGLRMKALKNHGLCLAGSIVAIILNGCSCVGFPIGIWALLALLRSDVKAGFDLVAKNGRT